MNNFSFFLIFSRIKFLIKKAKVKAAALKRQIKEPVTSSSTDDDSFDDSDYVPTRKEIIRAQRDAEVDKFLKDVLTYESDENPIDLKQSSTLKYDSNDDTYDDDPSDDEFNDDDSEINLNNSIGYEANENYVNYEPIELDKDEYFDDDLWASERALLSEKALSMLLMRFNKMEDRHISDDYDDESMTLSEGEEISMPI